MISSQGIRRDTQTRSVLPIVRSVVNAYAVGQQHWAAGNRVEVRLWWWWWWWWCKTQVDVGLGVADALTST